MMNIKMLYEEDSLRYIITVQLLFIGGSDLEQAEAGGGRCSDLEQAEIGGGDRSGPDAVGLFIPVL